MHPDERYVGDTTRLKHQTGLLVRCTRVRPKENARIVLIDLTPKGEQLAETLMPVAIHFEEPLTRGLDQNEITELKRLLKKVYENIDNL